MIVLKNYVRLLYMVGLLCIVAAPVRAKHKSWIEVSAVSDSIIWMGRHYNHDGSAYFSFPGVSMRVGYVADSLKARLIQLDGRESVGFYSIVDGTDTTFIQLEKGREEYLLATHKDKKKHTIELIRLNESQVGVVRFDGFSYYAKKVGHIAPQEERSRKMEFIGNSITCGYGIEDTSNTPGFTAVRQNITKTYGALVARNFHAQSHYVAASGYGLYRFVTGEDSMQTIPYIYNQSFLRPLQEMEEGEKRVLKYMSCYEGDTSTYPTKWNYAEYQPDVVVVNLGTNDFNATANCGVPTDSARFVKSGLTFLLRLRAHYPHAAIICVVGPMLSDDYPQGEMAWSRCQRYVKEMVQIRNRKKGDWNVYYFNFQPQKAPYGEDWHPSYITHRKMATELSDFIEHLNLEW